MARPSAMSAAGDVGCREVGVQLFGQSLMAGDDVWFAYFFAQTQFPTAPCGRRSSTFIFRGQTESYFALFPVPVPFISIRIIVAGFDPSFTA
jgi:hypothetical protein